MHTNRDREIVRWLGELGAAGAEHVGARFAMGRSWTYRRLQLLVADGLLHERRLLYQRPALYLASAEGLRWCGLARLPGFSVGAGGFEHSWQLAQLAAELPRLGARGVLSERMLRAAEAERAELLGSVRLGSEAGGRVALHRPDFALPRESGILAIEVELSVKAPRRLEEICRGYARARHLQGVLYLATPAAGRAVGRAVAATRAQERIRVLALGDSEALAGELRRAP